MTVSPRYYSFSFIIYSLVSLTKAFEIVIYPLVAMPFANTTDWNETTENFGTIFFFLIKNVGR